MSVELRILKGTNDFLPNEQILREKIITILKETFELYSFLPLETPVLEFYEILASKYAGGAEILKETYKLSDQGGRELALRYDLTIPLSRVIGMNPRLKFPFRRYEIGKVFRDGPIKVGRYREFTQCDVDIVGVKTMQAEAELVSLAYEIFKKFNIDINIELSNRKLLTGILIECGFTNDSLGNAILSLDKLKKIGKNGVKQELGEKGLKGAKVEKAFTFLVQNGDSNQIMDYYEKVLTNTLAKEGLEELRNVFRLISFYDIPIDSVKLVPSLARGLEIYTGTVFEIFAKGNVVTSSLAAGGRYDKIISQFLQSEQEYPAVGISFGLEPIYIALTNMENKLENKTNCLIISIKSDQEAIKIVSNLRKANIISEFDFRTKGITKSLDYANSMNFQYVIIVGPKEVKEGKFTLKNMKTGEEAKLSIEEIIKKLETQ